MSYGFALKGDICFSDGPASLKTLPGGYIVCLDGLCAGAWERLPERYAGLPLLDYSGKLVIPGLADLHTHAPQYAFRGAGMDLELLEWLDAHVFPEESKYSDLGYADRAYTIFADALRRGPNTRACVFATVHAPATMLLMDKLEASGLVTFVGKVNMDRNGPYPLREESAAKSAEDTVRWAEECLNRRYRNTRPILTPRFIPSCSDELMRLLKEIQARYGLPLQSHLSENQSECDWVSELCPGSATYGDAYASFGLFGGGVPTVMAHCVQSGDREIALMKRNGVYVAHCPQSNTNLVSGIAPARKFLKNGLKAGLGSDVAGGCHTSIFRAMSDAIQASKLYWRLVDQGCRPLSIEEAFYLGTVGGGSFFGKAGAFEEGFEFDAVIIDESGTPSPSPLGMKERLARAIYLSSDCGVIAKFVRGSKIL
ncbi:MAG: amidohydrolase family protein [Synergistaceae bacterium]|jgi:guanine deaminase|nr:amidohydrolase family protein [Synergistaceae bacterium]